MNAEQMLIYLEKVSNGNIYINLVNHIVVFISIFLCFVNIKYKKEVIFGSIAVLLLSVIGNAVYYGNPFHLVTFAIMMIFLIIAYFKNDKIENISKIDIYTIIALIFLALGIWYPEIVHANACLCLFFSPLGIVPCPTLLTIGGIINVFSTKINKKFFVCILTFITVYGIIGTFIFKVYYDILLLVLAIFSIINLRRKIN